MLIIGANTSFADKQLESAVQEAISYNANALMFYTGAPTNTIRRPIDYTYTTNAYILMNEHNIDINNVICHAPYIINLANKEKNEFGIEFLQSEIKRCEELGVNKIVIHPGSATNCTKEEGLNNIIEALNKIITKKTKVTILLETMAGKGNELGTTIEELKTIIDGIIIPDKIAVCIDTCHLHDSGINLDKFEEYLDQFNENIGINKIKCIHLNDSKNDLSSKKDRHQNIGLGKIGFDTLINIAHNKRLSNVPKILETPFIENQAPYKTEIEMIKNKNINQDYISYISSIS